MGWVDEGWVGGGPRGVVTRHVDGRCFLRGTRVCALCVRYVCMVCMWVRRIEDVLEVV